MRTTAKTALERAGYSVALANNGKEAVEVCRSTKADLILLLLDMTIPVLSRAEALAQIRQIRHYLPVIVISGYHENEVLRRFAGLGIAGFPPKPFTSSALIRPVASALKQQRLVRAS